MGIKLTKEQEDELEKMRLKNENETIYKCDECKERLVGMKNVRKHLNEKKHYCYNRPGMKGGFGFV